MRNSIERNRKRVIAAVSYIKIVVLLLFAAADAAEAQSGRLERLGDRPENTWSLELRGNSEFMFDTDIDGDGKFDLLRFGLSQDTTLIPDEKWRFTLGTSYSMNKFDFSGTGGIGSLDPWDNINVLNLSLRINYAFNDKWGVFAIPLLGFSGESGARFGDSLTGGGIAGFSYSIGRKLIIAFGGLVRSRIEDDVIGFPIAYLRWEITERLTLSTLASGVRTEIGPEVGINYDLGGGFSAGLSGGYEFSRFRLDSDGPFPGGVGDVKGMPIWGRISYETNSGVTFNGYGGYILIGSLELENSNGRRIEKDDFDPAPFIGGGISLKL